MEDEIFLKKMKGVKPIKKEEKKIIGKKKKLTKNITREKIKKNETQTIFNNERKRNTELSLTFGDINKELKKGKIQIDRKLDLHGYSLMDAYDKFKNEVIKNHNKNKRCLLVITGKGVQPNKKNNDTMTPKLFHGKIKNSIISWIKEDCLKNYILTYQNAGIDHGGDGAIFVYLRKNKN